MDKKNSVKYTYIKQSINGFFAEFNEQFDSELFNNIGETIADFYAGKWVLLSDEQAAFHTANPTASVTEVWNMELNPVVDASLEIAKMQKKHEIEEYDRSSYVNDFTVNNDIHAWLTADERANYRNSIDAAKLLNVANVSLFIGNMPITIPTQTAEVMLAQIQLYADGCFLVTKNHLLAIDQLESVEAVEEYDHTTGYPTKLNFNVE